MTNFATPEPRGQLGDLGRMAGTRRASRRGAFEVVGLPLVVTCILAGLAVRVGASVPIGQ